jgi:hypothetical protein
MNMDDAFGKNSKFKIQKPHGGLHLHAILHFTFCILHFAF